LNAPVLKYCRVSRSREPQENTRMYANNEEHSKYYSLTDRKHICSFWSLLVTVNSYHIHQSTQGNRKTCIYTGN